MYFIGLKKTEDNNSYLNFIYNWPSIYAIAKSVILVVHFSIMEVYLTFHFNSIGYNG